MSSIVKYRMYTVTDSNQKIVESFDKADLLKFAYSEEDEQNLLNCAHNMCTSFNSSLKDGEDKRYCYKLEKVKVQVYAVQSYPDLDVELSTDDLSAQYKPLNTLF